MSKKFKFSKDKLSFKNSKLKTPVYFDETYKLYFNPVKTKKELDDFYKNEYWDDYGREDKQKLFFKIDSLLSNNFNLISPTYYSDLNLLSFENKKVLEIGCGFGTSIKYLFKEGIDVKGVEIDPKNVKLINSEVKKNIIKQGNYEDINLDEKYDIIILRHVFEHFFNVELVIEKFEKNLNKDGVLFLNVPNAQNKEILLESVENHPHTFHFTKKSFELIFNKTKLKPISIKTYSWKTKNKIKLLIMRFLKISNLKEDSLKDSEFLIGMFKKI